MILRSLFAQSPSLAPRPCGVSWNNRSRRTAASCCAEGGQPDPTALNREGASNSVNPKVQQVMNRKVHYLHEDDTIRNAIQMFLSCGVSGAPVLGEDRKLVGVLSESDVIAHEAGCKLEMLSGSSADCSLPLNVSLFQLLVQDYKRDKLLQLLDLKVMDIMTKDLIVVSPDSTVFLAAKIMKENKVNRLPVVDNEDVVGIITRGDVLQYMIWEILMAANQEN